MLGDRRALVAQGELGVFPLVPRPFFVHDLARREQPSWSFADSEIDTVILIVFLYQSETDEISSFDVGHSVGYRFDDFFVNRPGGEAIMKRV